MYMYFIYGFELGMYWISGSAFGWPNIRAFLESDSGPNGAFWQFFRPQNLLPYQESLLSVKHDWSPIMLKSYSL